MSTLSFAYGTRTIEFRLERRPVRSLVITVQADGKVRVIAPLHASDEQVVPRVKKRARWVVKQWERQAGYLPTLKARAVQSGSSIRYLGRQYRVRLRTRGDEREPVRLYRSELELRVRDKKDLQEVQQVLQTWLRKRAHTILEARFVRCLEMAARHKLPRPKLRLRKMPKRWGSCIRKDCILLNPELICASSACIDYVITHEICHLKHSDHGPKFRALLQQLCPDWKRLKARLECYNG